MSETAWFRRGDGAEFEVPLGSDAFAALVAQGAIRFEPSSAAEPDLEDLGINDLRVRARELGLAATKVSRAELIGRMREAQGILLGGGEYPEGAEALADPEEGGE